MFNVPVYLPDLDRIYAVKTEKITFGCNFDFTSFPFDENVCPFEFLMANLKEFLVLKKFSIAPQLSFKPNERFEIQTGRIPYTATVTMNGTYYIQDGLRAPINSILFHLKRERQTTLIAGYFVPTGIFPVLALLSFLIKPEVVRS